jgi:hypothetical protein
MNSLGREPQEQAEEKNREPRQGRQIPPRGVNPPSAAECGRGRESLAMSNGGSEFLREGDETFGFR